MICPNCGEKTKNGDTCEICGKPTEFAAFLDYQTVGAGTDAVKGQDEKITPVRRTSVNYKRLCLILGAAAVLFFILTLVLGSILIKNTQLKQKSAEVAMAEPFVEDSAAEAPAPDEQQAAQTAEDKPKTYEDAAEAEAPEETSEEPETAFENPAQNTEKTAETEDELPVI